MKITFSGVDTYTDLGKLTDLAYEHPESEWAFLYSPSKAGYHPRYPSAYFISVATGTYEIPPSVNLAVHFCGLAVADLLSGSKRNSDAWNLYERVTGRGGRVQLNIPHEICSWNAGLPALMDFLDRDPAPDVILQLNDYSHSFIYDLDSEIAQSFSALCDKSGGRGKSPEEWEPVAFKNNVRVGYAGGLGPTNISTELKRLPAGADWIDMESGVRTAYDHLSLEMCEDVLEKFRLYKAS